LPRKSEENARNHEILREERRLRPEVAEIPAAGVMMRT
jgi:hypothetical protein